MFVCGGGIGGGGGVAIIGFTHVRTLSRHVLELDLSSNGLNEIPPSIFSCRGLQVRACFVGVYVGVVLGWKGNGGLGGGVTGSDCTDVHTQLLSVRHMLLYALCSQASLTTTTSPHIFPARTFSQTLVLGFNSLSDLSGLPWAALSTLENLDVSSNHLRTLGDVVLMTWLRRLNLENNEINPLPLELGLCTGSWLLCCCRTEDASQVMMIAIARPLERSA